MIDDREFLIAALLVLFGISLALAIVANETNKDLVEELNNQECPRCNQDIAFVQEAYRLMNEFCYDDLALCQEQLRVCIPGELSARVERSND